MGTIILSGAGAAIPWGAPSTWSITENIRKDETFRSVSGRPIGDWIHHKLTGIYHIDPNTVNFETILNAIEYLITFYSSRDRRSISKFKNVMPAFLKEKDDIWELLWFDKIYEKNNQHWRVENRATKYYGTWQDFDYFFEEVFRYFINRIISHVERYSIKADSNTILNKDLDRFLSKLKKPIRCYTLNYDRVIPAVSNLKFFEGFTPKGEVMKFDFRKVLTDSTSNIYYNLHGSVHYDLDFPSNVKHEPNKFIYNFGAGASDSSDQDSKKIVNSNIITAFNKPSRILGNPHSQFYHRFYEDCLTADKIYIVGYSFGDAHINSAIKTSSIVNTQLEIEIVTHMVYDEDLEIEAENDWIKLGGNGENFISDDFNIYEIANESNHERIKIFRKGFEQFMKRLKGND